MRFSFMVRNKGRRRNKILFAFLCAGLLFCGCSQIKNGRQGAETSAETTPGLQPIDIPSPNYFLRHCVRERKIGGVAGCDLFEFGLIF